MEAFFLPVSKEGIDSGLVDVNPLKFTGILFLLAFPALAQTGGEKALQANLSRYGLTAGWYVREAVATNFSERAALDYFHKKNRRAFPDRVPFLLYTPQTTSTNPLPLLVFLPGKGELGKDLNKLFSQKGIIEKVTSKAFQEAHPCRLLIPSPPDSFRTLMDGLPHRPSLAQNLMNDAILAVARARQSPPVDLNRRHRSFTVLANGTHTFAAA